MSDWATEPGSLRGHPTATQSAATLFGQTMGYVAITVRFFALGAYLGRNLTYGWGWVTFLAAFACLFGMRFAVRQSATLAAGLLFVFGSSSGSPWRRPSPTTPAWTSRPSGKLEGPLPSS